jgi:5-amino-6-(5-phospho-D-ribitylamino)uracil phosphatase
MNTLYISDLDGTLLNKNAELSQYTIGTLNALLKEGMNFTIATARSAATVDSILKELHLPLPVILMNGVLIYDFTAKNYLNIEYLSTDSLHFIQKVLKDHHLTGFMYDVKDQVQTTYYETLANKAQREFYEERVNKYQKSFTKVSDFSEVNPEHIIYFALLDKAKHLEPVYQILKNRTDIALAYYKDIYSEDDIWYLEIFSVKATKYNAVQYLRNKYHYERIIGFGDNLNDLPLFKACNVTCAVNNAKEELKAAATHIIGSNTEDGVAGWLRRNYI